MGHDITIMDEKGNVVAETGITGNFSVLQKDEIATINQFHGHTGCEVSEMILESLKNLKRGGWTMAEFDKENPNWGWGVEKNGKRMSYDDMVEVYMWRLNKFLKVAFDHPNCLWWSDQVFDVISIDDLVKQGFLSEDSKKYIEEEKSKKL